jgi:hypothetical protein
MACATCAQQQQQRRRGVPPQAAGAQQQELSIQQLGHVLWPALHSLTLCYPRTPTPQDQWWAEQFMLAVAHLLPCEQCRLDFGERVRAGFPAAAESRERLFLWLCEAHNDDARRRPGGTQYSVEQVREACLRR